VDRPDQARLVTTGGNLLEAFASPFLPTTWRKSLLARRASSLAKRRDFTMRIVPSKENFMANRIIVFWRDIPAQVIVKKGRATAKRELSLRFTEAIDMCAMRTGAAETDDYLAEWRRADPVEVSDDLEAEADRAAAELEAAYDKERLIALVKGGGRLSHD
jgi:hypothetical protein